MQRCSITLRLAGNLLHTVQKSNVSPAEILILKHIHGDDAVVDIRPVSVDTKTRHEDEWARLAQVYDRGAGAFTAQPGEERKSIMGQLFPGAMRKLPTKLSEIGIPDLDPVEPKGRGRKPAPTPEPEPEPDAEPEADADADADAPGTDGSDDEPEAEAPARGLTFGNVEAGEPVADSAPAEGE